MAKKNTKTDQEIARLGMRVLKHEYTHRAEQVNLGDFRRLHAWVTSNRKNVVPVTSLVNLGGEVFVQFSDLSPQRFLVVGKRIYCEDDFDFIINKKWHGSIQKTPGLAQFLVNELRINKLALGLVFILTIVMISFAKNDDLYDLMAELIVSSATVFLSIFLIFTVTQNQVLHSDRKMFESGILQRYYADDRHLAIMAVLTIFFAIASAMMAKISQQPPIKNWSIQQVVLLDRHVVLGFVYGVSLVFLFDTFLSIVNYYLGRTRDLVERDIVGYILHEDLLKYCPEAQAHKDEITP